MLDKLSARSQHVAQHLANLPHLGMSEESHLLPQRLSPTSLHIRGKENKLSATDDGPLPCTLGLNLASAEPAPRVMHRHPGLSLLIASSQSGAPQPRVKVIGKKVGGGAVGEGHRAGFWAGLEESRRSSRAP